MVFFQINAQNEQDNQHTIQKHRALLYEPQNQPLRDDSQYPLKCAFHGANLHPHHVEGKQRSK